jgi:hypothetical protein
VLPSPTGRRVGEEGIARRDANPIVEAASVDDEDLKRK